MFPTGPMPLVLATNPAVNPAARGGMSPETADLIGQGIGVVGSLAGTWLQNRAQGKSREEQDRYRQMALRFEREKYANEKAATDDDRAWRNAVRQAWAERYGVGWSPQAGAAATLGSPAPVEIATAGAEPDDSVDADSWNQWG